MASAQAQPNSDSDTDTKAEQARASVPGQKAGDKAGEKSAGAVRRSERPGSVSHHALVTPEGKTHIADTVVAKIAAFATREIPGVHSMGRGLTRRIGALRAMVPGQTEGMSTQGVSVEVGEKQAAIDLDIVTWYGESILEVSEAVRRNVIERLESMTGLEVVEVNIHVDDIHIDDPSAESAQEPAPARVK